MPFLMKNTHLYSKVVHGLMLLRNRQINRHVVVLKVMTGVVSVCHR